MSLAERLIGVSLDLPGFCQTRPKRPCQEQLLPPGPGTDPGRTGALCCGTLVYEVDDGARKAPYKLNILARFPPVPISPPSPAPQDGRRRRAGQPSGPPRCHSPANPGAGVVRQSTTPHHYLQEILQRAITSRWYVSASDVAFPKSVQELMGRFGKRCRKRWGVCVGRTATPAAR